MKILSDFDLDPLPDVFPPGSQWRFRYKRGLMLRDATGTIKIDQGDRLILRASKLMLLPKYWIREVEVL